MYATRGDDLLPEIFLVCRDCGRVEVSEYGCDAPDKCTCGTDDWRLYLPEDEDD